MAKLKTVIAESGKITVATNAPVAKTAAEILNTEIGEWSAYCVVAKTIAYNAERRPLRGTRAEAEAAAAAMARGVVCRWDDLMDRINSGFPFKAE